MTTCAVVGCDRTAAERGWCHAHYRRWTRTGDPGPPQIGAYGQGNRTCAVEGCGRPRYSHALCSAHYMAWWRERPSGR